MHGRPAARYSPYLEKGFSVPGTSRPCSYTTLRYVAMASIRCSHQLLPAPPPPDEPPLLDEEEELDEEEDDELPLEDFEILGMENSSLK